MNNNYGIQQYLVEPDFAHWLKQQGFDGECCAWGRPHHGIRITGSASNKNIAESNFAVPTFAQAFDFVKEKFNLQTKTDEFKGGSFSFTIDHNKSSETVLLAFAIGTPIFKTKREASVAACNAIKEYINGLQKDRV